MARTGRPKAELVLTSAEHEQLTRWARRASSAQALALRSRIVLGCAEGLDNKVVAAEVGCEEHTVSKWRRRFVEHRLDGLSDEARPGRPATIGVDQVEDVIVATPVYKAAFSGILKSWLDLMPQFGLAGKAVGYPVG